MSGTTPEELLEYADQLLTSPVAGLGSLWPRACALLIRLALEQGLDRYWAGELPEAAACGMRQQLLLLPLYADTPAQVSAASGAASASGEASAAAQAPASAGEASAQASGVAAQASGEASAASLAREAWLGLAGAAHHHAYELAPTAAELRRWHRAVSQLLRLLSPSPSPSPSPTPSRSSSPSAAEP